MRIVEARIGPEISGEVYKKCKEFKGNGSGTARLHYQRARAPRVSTCTNGPCAEVAG